MNARRMTGVLRSVFIVKFLGERDALTIPSQRPPKYHNARRLQDMGRVLGPVEGIAAATNLQSQSTSNPTSISQKAAVEALKGPQDAVATMLAEFAWRRDDILKRTLDIPGVTCTKPGGAFYLFPNFSAYYGKLKPAPGQSNSQALADYLLTEARLAAVPGNEFGEDNCLRFSYATSRERIATGLSRIKEALEKLGK